MSRGHERKEAQRKGFFPSCPRGVGVEVPKPCRGGMNGKKPVELTAEQAVLCGLKLRPPPLP